jgi:hypothetical protein
MLKTLPCALPRKIPWVVDEAPSSKGVGQASNPKVTLVTTK